MSVDRGFVKEMVDLIDGDAWHLADRLVEMFPTDKFGAGQGRENTGLYAELEALEDVLRREHGIEYSWRTMRNYRATALAWTDESRDASVPFDVHLFVRGLDRREQMASYKRRAAREGFALTKKMVGRFRADDRGPKPLLPLDERLRNRVSSLVKSMLVGNVIIKRDDWWASKSAPVQSRRIAADVLRQLAEDIAP